MKKLFLIILFLIAKTQLFAQGGQNPTSIYEWNQSGTSLTGERIVATLNSGTIGSYTGIALVGQIIDGTSNWGFTMPVVANFKVFVNFTSSLYGLQQDVATPSVTLELKSLSATQVALVANCPLAWRQVRILFRYTNGNCPPLTLGDPQTITTAGTMLISQPTYSNESNGRLAINVTNKAKAAGYMLAVGGKAIAEQMTVQLQGNWPDYVFAKNYPLPALSDVKAYIDKNQHLPEIPPADVIANEGQNLGELNKLLLKKVEELTLYIIENERKDKEREAAKDKAMTFLQQQINKLKQQSNKKANKH